MHGRNVTFGYLVLVCLSDDLFNCQISALITTDQLVMGLKNRFCDVMRIGVTSYGALRHVPPTGACTFTSIWQFSVFQFIIFM